MPIGYNFSGDWNDYSSLLRKYTLDKLLMAINRESANLINTDDPEIYSTKTVKLTTIEYRTKGIQNGDVMITAWGLIDLAYHAIIASNDYRGRSIETENEMALLCSADYQYTHEEEKKILEEVKNTPKFIIYLWGFSGEQFKMQGTQNIFASAARELYILLEVSKRIGKIDVQEVVYNQTGLSWMTILSTLLLSWFTWSKGNGIGEIRDLIEWDDTFREEDYDKVIGLYTTNYKEVRDSNLGRQIFYAKPYVKTQRGDTISINCFLNLFLYEHCILWIVRDYYKNISSREFTSYFGSLFEEYFKEVLSMYLLPGQYEKIKETTEERADWRMEIGGFKFLIEQKSTLLRLASKKQLSDYESTISFLKGTVIKALKQLETTEKSLGDGEYLKLILLYDNYLYPAILDEAFNLPECNVLNDHRYWIVTVDEVEMLLYTSKTDIDTFRAIIHEKIKREMAEDTSKGKNVQQLFVEKGIKENHHISQEKYDYYRTAIIDNVRKRLPNPEEGM